MFVRMASRFDMGHERGTDKPARPPGLDFFAFEDLFKEPFWLTNASKLTGLRTFRKPQFEVHYSKQTVGCSHDRKSRAARLAPLGEHAKATRQIFERVLGTTHQPFQL